MNSKVAYFAAALGRYWIKPQLWFILYWVYAADLNGKATFHILYFHIIFLHFYTTFLYFYILCWVNAADLNGKATFHSSCNQLLVSFKWHIWQIGQIHLAILTNIFSSLDKYIVAILSNAAVLRDLVFSFDQFSAGSSPAWNIFCKFDKFEVTFFFYTWLDTKSIAPMLMPSN